MTLPPATPPTPPCMQNLVAEGVIEKFVGLDMSDTETVFDRCLDACLKIKRVRAGQPAERSWA